MHIIYDIKSKIASELAGFGFDSSSWQLNLSTAQNVFSKFRPGWWQFCWMTGVKFNSIRSFLVRFLHITQFTVCAAKNLTVFVADSPRCLEWSSMVAAVLRALRELSEPCLGWTREPRRQPKSLGARRQYSQATANNVLPVMTGSPAFLTRPPPGNCVKPILWRHCCISYRCYVTAIVNVFTINATLRLAPGPQYAQRSVAIIVTSVNHSHTGASHPSS